MKRRYQQDAENGHPHGPARAFGYTPDHHLDPVTAPAVRKAYSDMLAGASLRGIAIAWNKAGFTSARGKQWDATGVRAVLLNAKNCGLRSHNGVIVAEGTWPPIVDRDLFDGVKAVLTDKNRTVGRMRGRKYLLSGLAVCGKCGHTLSSAMPSGRGGQPRYHCKNCLGVARKVEWVDEWVLSIVAERLSRPDARDLLHQRGQPALTALRDAANAARARQDEMASAFADGAVTMAQLQAFTKRIEQQLADIDAKLVDANKSRVFDGVIASDRAAVLKRLDGLDLDRKRAVIDALLTVAIMPGQRRGAFRPDLCPITWK